MPLIIEKAKLSVGECTSPRYFIGIGFRLRKGVFLPYGAHLVPLLDQMPGKGLGEPAMGPHLSISLYYGCLVFSNK